MNYALIRRSAADRAIDRDCDDIAQLTALRLLVTRWLDEIIPYASDLQHPARRWAPSELVEALTDAVANIDGETDRLRGPLMVEDEP